MLHLSVLILIFFFIFGPLTYGTGHPSFLLFKVFCEKSVFWEKVAIFEEQSSQLMCIFWIIDLFSTSFSENLMSVKNLGLEIFWKWLSGNQIAPFSTKICTDCIWYDIYLLKSFEGKVAIKTKTWEGICKPDYVHMRTKNTSIKTYHLHDWNKVMVILC